jgi:hypothetical protein
VFNNEKYLLPPIDHNLSKNSTIKENLGIAWHGVQSLLQKAERSAAGTPAQGPIAIVNVLIELGNVCPLTFHSMYADICHRPLSTTRTHWRKW